MSVLQTSWLPAQLIGRLLLRFVFGGGFVAVATACAATHAPAGKNQPVCDEPDSDCGAASSGPADASSSEHDAGLSACEGVVTSPNRVELRDLLPLASHREVAVACAETRPCNHVSSGVPQAMVCRSHSDCTQGANGRCQPFGYACTYDACFTDGDCGADQLCDCTGGGDTAHRCVPAQCRTDADCADGRWCSPSRPVQCYNLTRVSAYRCHTPADECTTDVDCTRGGGCVFDPDRSHWRCTDSVCTVP